LGIPFWELTDLESLGRGVGRVLNGEEQHRVEYQRALTELRERAMQNRQVLAGVLR
ncbi:MAG: hypothetical protein GX971_09645, partial [Firmicutes bacterium]|nr:hypothetical protein [Bacillota bacterium]